MTKGSTSMGSLTFQGFLTRFFKELTRFPRRKWMRKLWSSILSLSIKRCVCFVYPGIPRDSSANINAYDKETLDNLSSAFSDVDQPCSNVQPEQPSPTTIILLYLYDPEGPFPSEEDNNVVVEPISLDKRHSIECYVMDVVDPLNSVHSTGCRSLYSSPKLGQGQNGMIVRSRWLKKVE